MLLGYWYIRTVDGHSFLYCFILTSATLLGYWYISTLVVLVVGAHAVTNSRWTGFVFYGFISFGCFMITQLRCWVICT